MLQWILAGLIAGVLLLMATKAKASEQTGFDALFQKWGGVYNVDWRLIKAHAMRESGLHADAVNPDDPSYGLMQLLCRPDGRGSCANALPAVADWPPASTTRLLDPDYSIKIAAQIIAANQRSYGMPRAIAVYNRFDQRLAPINGPFKNQGYVNDVLRNYEELKNG